ncbi:MAG: hypothetical protein RLZZ624_503 [Cyanobacteriota bacterium]|jgi:thiamine-phosphate pyrophosphorylase
MSATPPPDAAAGSAEAGILPPSEARDQQQAVDRLLDANLDRAREGLRVLEDWCRFVLERPDLVARLKDMRQRLGLVHDERYKLARHTATDPAAGLAHPAQEQRGGGWAVVAANAARAQEALRVLEEFGRSRPGALAQEAAAIRYGLYDLETELLQARLDGPGRRQRLAQCRLYLIVGHGPEQEPLLEAALAAGVRLVQYRAKEGIAGLTDRQRLQEARALRQRCAAHGALFLVNDRIDLALAVGADGVHLGQDDLPTAEARRLLGPNRLIGRSTHALAQLQQALAEGCDYVGVGPVQATPTKPGKAPVGLEYVRQAVEHCPIPFFAIGGIDAATLPLVLAAGASRVAVVRAITAAADPGAASRELLAALQPQENQ